MQVPYGIGSYKRLDLPQVVLRNFYVEKAETVPGSIILVPRPALKNYQVAGPGPIRGLFYQGGVFNNMLFAVSGSALYSGTTLIGDIAAAQRVRMAIADTVLMIATGTALWTSGGTTVSQVAFPDGAGVVDVLYLAAYAVAVRAGSRRIYFTLDATTWDPLDFVSAQQSTANIVGIAIVVDQIWLFCQDHTEIFYASGDATAPFQRVQGRVFDKGCLSRDSIVRMDNTVLWVGNDGIVYRGEGNPVRISDHGIEERIAESAPADLVAWSYPWKGHLFYVLRTATGTFAYDAATAQWTEFSSYDMATWSAATGFNYNGAIICGGDTNGQLWALTDGSYADDNTPVLAREFTVLLNDNGFVDNFALDCSVGMRPTEDNDPGLIELRTSRDSGQNWTNWRSASLGKLGKSRTYARWRRLGIVDEGNMVIHVRVSDPVASRVSYIRMNENTAGRAR